MATYKEAGVDVDAGDEAVRRIRPHVRRTYTPNVLADIGAFGAFYELDLDGIERPVLVSSVDGVGTKLRVAVRAERFDTVGQDLVNHCVNDIAVCGARPLFFLDYYATGALDPATAESIVKGFTTACRANRTALIGGEIAEMPGIYAEDDFDLVGCVVGLVDKGAVLDARHVEAGDVLLGLPSTGLHTNGYTLARKVLFTHVGVDDAPPELGGPTLGEALLAVHRSYLTPIRALADAGLAHAFAHVTGGGLRANTLRVVPGDCDLALDFGAWTRPALFGLIQALGDVPEADMRRTFNLGVGLVAVVGPDDADAALDLLGQHGETAFQIGEVVRSS